MKIINKLFDVHEENKKYLLVGSPNVGKSSIFNRITWKNSPVANFDRLTTTFHEGTIRKNNKISVIDLPGVNSLNPIGDDEKETFNYIFNEQYDGIVNIISALSLQRDLYLTCQLAEAGILNYVVINMVDELDNAQSINKLTLTRFFNCPITLSSIKQKDTINEIIYSLNIAKFNPKPLYIQYGKKIEKIIEQASEFIEIKDLKISKRFLITQAIVNNIAVIDFLKKHKCYDQIKEVINNLNLSDSEVNEIFNKKLDYLKKVINVLLMKQNESFFKQKKQLTSKADKILLNPWFAIPIFILVIVAIYFITFYQYAGGYLQKLLADDALGALQAKISESIINLNQNSDPEAWWAMFVSDGLLGGIFTIISFTPWVVILILLTTILEQIGFLSRMSVVFDNVFSKFGLSGRSIVSLITGIGCNVPAILLAKNSNSIKEKVISIFIAPFVSCSARIVVFGYLGSAIFGPNFNWAINIIMTFSSVVIALFIGYCFSNIWFRKANTIFISELPKYRSVDFLSLFKKIFLEVFSFIKRTIIIVGIANLIIWLFMYTSPSSIYLIDPFEEQNHSFLWYISYPLRYILYPLGIGYDWRLCISLISALPAKEIIASNIELLFDNVDIFAQQIGSVTFFVIPTIFAYLFFISLYIPCIATIAIMKKEIGLKYTLIHIVFSLFFAYGFSLIVFSLFSGIQTINNHYMYDKQVQILIFITCLFLFIPLVILFLKKYLENKNYLITNGFQKGYQIIKYGSIGIAIGSIIAIDVLTLIIN